MKILFYGFRHGHIVGLYNKAKQNKRVEIVACLEDNESARNEVAENSGIVFDTSRSYDEWLETDVDIVALGGAYGDRGVAAIKALKAGKHLILDKPICIKIEELDEMEKLAREKNLKIACMLDLRYMPSARKVKELLESGEFGEVRNVSFTGQHCLSYGSRASWYFEKGKHGGTLNDIAIHGVDLIMHLTGLTFDKINASRTWNAFATQEPDFNDCGMFMAQLSNGAGVMADVSYAGPSQIYTSQIYWNFKLWCDNGLINFNINSPDVTLYRMNETSPCVVEGIKDEKNYLDDLLDEIQTNGDEMTDSVIASTRTTLTIQGQAK